jgi:hypothetical protein
VAATCLSGKRIKKSVILVSIFHMKSFPRKRESWYTVEKTLDSRFRGNDVEAISNSAIVLMSDMAFPTEDLIATR